MQNPELFNLQKNKHNASNAGELFLQKLLIVFTTTNTFSEIFSCFNHYSSDEKNYSIVQMEKVRDWQMDCERSRQSRHLVKQLPVNKEGIIRFGELSCQEGEKTADLRRGEVRIVHHNLKSVHTQVIF